MAPPLLLLQGIRLTLGGKPLLEGADLSLSPGERLCVVGRNGSGKTTLLKIAAGEIEADGGTRFAQPDATVRYLPQEPDLSGFASVAAYVEAGLGPADDRHRAAYLLERLGVAGARDPAHLSGGELRRAALARVLAPAPDILLFDEPTNHLDLPTIEWLERELAGLRSAFVLVSHDRRFLANLSRATVWLDRGRTRRIERGFAAFEAWRDETLDQEASERHKLDRRIAMEEDWVRYGVTARRKRNQGRMERLRELRTQRRDARRVQGSVRMAAGEAAMSGKLVIEAERVSKEFGGRPIVRDFSIRILRGDRIGIVGANGAGKTTLLRLLTGELAPDAGTVRAGANLQMATLDQSRASLDAAATLKDTLTGGGSDTVMVGGQAKHVVGYMGDFLFAPEQARTPVGKLSGGERGRLALARTLALPSNLLVLDEPTNDLDLETLDLLQELIANYPGTVLVVSHDRDFLDRVATALIVAEGDGAWIEYAGGYTDMVAQRGFGVGGEAAATRAPRSERPRAAGAGTPPSPSKRKLSFKEKHALETLPRRIEALRARSARLQATLDDSGLFIRDPAAFHAASAALVATQAEIARAEDDWLEIELLREEIGG